MRFEARDLKFYAEPVTADRLRDGAVYFSVMFVDERMLIPIVEPWVFTGRGLDPDDAEDRLYFQDVESYMDGVRFATATANDAAFQVALPTGINHIFEFEHALDQLLKCSLRRKNAA
jgi:hypothetical protein